MLEIVPAFKNELAELNNLDMLNVEYCSLALVVCLQKF
jgi:hypothetical protein